jgi:hypothetical protein
MTLADIDLLLRRPEETGDAAFVGGDEPHHDEAALLSRLG